MRAMGNSDLDRHARAVASGAASDIAEAKAEIRARLDKIETLLGYLTAKMLVGEALRASDTPILDFFGISNKNPDPLKMIRSRAATRIGKVLGNVECPSCGSNVRDIEGVLDETCTFCGAKVTTQA